MKRCFQYLSFPFFLLLLQACSNNSKPITDNSQQDTLLPPYVIPKDSVRTVITLLDTAIKPKVIPFALPKSSLPKDKDGLPMIGAIRAKSRFTNFTMADGLGLNTIKCAILDHYGNLWFGHDGSGVTRYDGKTFTTFTNAQGLASNYVNGITEDQSGNLLFLTQGSFVSRFDGIRFTLFGKTVPTFNFDFVSSIIKDRAGDLWFASGTGVSRFDGKSFKFYTTTEGLPSNDVTAICQDRSGKMWFGTNGRGISCYDGKKFNTFTKAQGLADDYVGCITEDRSGNLWFGTPASGVSRYDGNTFTTYTKAQGLASDSIMCITEDKSGNIWFGTFGAGASQFNGKSFTSFTTTEGLSSNAIYTITVDNSGSIWFGTYGAGICRYDGDAFTIISMDQGLAYNSVISIGEDSSGNMWFGSSRGGLSRGVSMYDGKRFTRVTSNHLAGDEVRMIRSDREGNLWFSVANGGGLTKFDGKNLTLYNSKHGLAGDDIRSLMVDKQGNIWVGGAGGISVFDGKSISTTYLNFYGMSEIFQDQSGNIWFGIDGGGLMKYDGNSYSRYSSGQGLPDNDIRCIAQDKKGNLWIGTGLGVSRFDGKRFDNLTTTEGLDDNNVYDIIFDQEENMYISTNVGIIVLPASVTSLPVSKMREGMKYFSIYQGYPVSSVWRNSMYCDSKGIIWIGTANETAPLIRFDPSALPKPDSLPPSLVIQHIKIDQLKICWSDLSPNTEGRSQMDDDSSIIMPANITEENLTFRRTLSAEERETMRNQFGDIRFDSITSFYLLPVNLRLPQTHNNISIDFNATEVAHPNLVNYQYILEGYSKDWSPVSKSTTASFGNMYEGNYTFKVKAQGPNGIWSEPVTYSFSVLPPWWRTWWAYTFYILTFLAALRAFSKWRERNLRLEKEKLEAKVDIRTKQLNESIETIKSTQSQLIQSEKMASLGELTAGIAHEIQNPLNFVNNFSEVNKELITEMRERIASGNYDEVDALAKDVEENEEKIKLHGQRADAIVKGMLQHSRGNSGHKEPTDINALVDGYLRLAYHGLRAKDTSFNVTLKTNYDENIRKTSLIPQDIGRALLNIFHNAFYAVNEKAKEQIAGFEPTVSASTKRNGNNIEMKVEDNGNGIPATIVDKIFQPFFTTKPTGKGTGLGLSLAFDIVKAHGGEIKVSSRPGEYSTFTITLPY
jgi:ligand-binding sensor domain-containing protein/signal transduction histidine kinase